MNKKTIGIDLNEVIRAIWHQFDKYYIEEFGEENVQDEVNMYTLNFWEKYRWEDTEEVINYLNEELPENISPIEYQIDEKTGIAPVDHMAFKKEMKIIPAKEVFHRFLYENYCYEIFGSANMIYRNLNLDLDKFFIKYKDEFDVYIVSKENWFSIPPTLFFLSKINSRVKNYFFYETNEEVWNKIDILITANPDLMHNVSEDKKIVKIVRPFNEDINMDCEYLNIFDIIENDKNFNKYIN
jgi:hypothetical protein